MSQQTQSPGPVWRVQMFGVLRLVSTDGATNTLRFRTKTTGSLLAYLAYHKGKPLPREVIIDALWPNLSAESARNSLNVAVSTLRVQLARPPFERADVFISDMQNLGLNPALFVSDVAPFERAIARAKRATEAPERLAALEEAVALYSGDLLMGRYDDWIEAEQDRLRQMYQAALAEQSRLSAGIVQAALGRGIPSPPAPPAPPATPETVGVHSKLPGPVTRFFGRKGELVFISARLSEFFSDPAGSGRIITLSGIGGIGKSRLATEAARRVETLYAGRVWFVELALITDAGQIWVRLRDALGLPKQTESDAEGQIIAFLSTAPALLVLDNMEQFVASGEAVDFVNSLRARLPSLALLVTSRHVVGAYGEEVLPLGSLLAPASWLDQTATPGDAQNGIELLADRARAVRANFAITDGNEAALHQLCQALDGIPLAIELAAARLSLMSPALLLVQLRQGKTLIKSLRKDIPERHRSLYSALQTSYQALPDHLQRVFCFLSVFRGGFTPEAAAFVCELETDALWDALGELSERSLLLGLGGEDMLRFRMLDTLRDFASDHLHADGSAAESAGKERHRQFFARLVNEAEPHIKTGETDTKPWLDALEADHDNLRAALDADAPLVERLQMATRLNRFWFLRGFTAEGRRRLRAALTLSEISAGISAGISTERGETVSNTVSNLDRAKAWNAVGVLSWALGEMSEAQNAFQAALSRYRQENDPAAVAPVLNNLGIISAQNGLLEAAAASYTECLGIYRNLGDTARQSIVLSNLGAVFLYQENFALARVSLEEALQIHRAMDDKPSVGRTLNTLAEVVMRQGDHAASVNAVWQGLSLRREIGDWSTLWEPLVTAAIVLSRCENDTLFAAAVIWGAAQSLRQLHDGGHVSAPPIDVAEEVELVARLAALVDSDKASAVGRAMSSEQALDFACESLHRARAPT